MDDRTPANAGTGLKDYARALRKAQRVRRRASDDGDRRVVAARNRPQARNFTPDRFVSRLASAYEAAVRRTEPNVTPVRAASRALQRLLEQGPHDVRETV